MKNSNSTQKISLQKIIEYWKIIDLNGKRNELDSIASEIVNNKESSILSRKKLTEQTKIFRKLEDSEKINSFGALLKLYQEEIDKLTKRSKHAEVSFLNIYKLLAEAPDPLLGLQEVFDNSLKSNRIVELEIENKKYKTELDEFKKEFQEIQNQEVTIRRLEEKILEYENNIEKIVQERIKENEKVTKEEYQKNLDMLVEREKTLTNQLSFYQSELTKIQYLFESTQSELIDLKTKYDEKQSAKQSELDFIMEELERSRSKILLLEKERENFFEQNKFTKLNNDSYLNSTDLELALAQKDIEISQLKEHIQKLEQHFLGETNLSKNEINSLKEQLQIEREKVKTLTKELEQKPSLNEFIELKNQLDILQNTLEYDNENISNDEKTAEKILKERNRKLETENVQLKVTISSKDIELNNLKDELNKSEQSIIELKELIKKLEEDISKESNQIKSKMLEDILHPTNPNQDINMLQIIRNQRDRFKSRLLELESDNKELYQKIEQFKNQVESLREDNIKLYEKIKYLQSYKFQQAKNLDIEANKQDILEEKYSQLYEETINPFILFNRKEKNRRYKELNPAEKVVLTSGQFFLSTKSSRIFLFFYSIMLHILVFITLYKLANSSSLK